MVSINSTTFCRLRRSPSRRSTLSEDDEAVIKKNDPPTLSRLYGEAAQWKEFLAANGCIDVHPTPGIPGPDPSGFAHLIAGDLTDQERAAARRAYKLNVLGTSLDPIEEPKSIKSKELWEDIDHKRESASLEFPPERAQATEPWRLNPEKLVQLLIEEFGALTEGEEQEELLLEADGAVILHLPVIIVGVIHFTTHRVAFHASLADSQPGAEDSASGLIKSGTAIIHRKGWRPKLRVWMELSQDMMCTYPTHNDEGNVKPLNTILLASVHRVLPADPTEPCRLRLQLGVGRHQNIVDLEFETEEAALDWRREITGAVFLNHHRQHEALTPPLGTHPQGVRFSIPITEISEIEHTVSAEIPSVAMLQITPNFQGDCSKWNRELNTPVERHSINIGTLFPSETWNRFHQYVTKVNQAHREAPAQRQPIFLDMGPLGFSSSESNVHHLPSKEDGLRTALALDAWETDLWIVHARLYGRIFMTGYFVISPHYVCFWGKHLLSTPIRRKISLENIEDIKTFRVPVSHADGLHLQFKDHRPLKLIFGSSDVRDEAVRRIQKAIEYALTPITPSSSSEATSEFSSTTSISSGLSQPHPHRNATSIIAPLARSIAASVAIGLPPAVQLKAPKAINLPTRPLGDIQPRHFVCLTIGSRGDVQPYIALALGLKKKGHKVTIVTHQEYAEWIRGFGIQHRTAGGDPGALMKLSVENKMFSPEFFRQSLRNFRPWLDQLLVDAWNACHDADVLLESPSAMAGVHIAEALGIPYFRTFTMPWSKTSEFPHPFLSPPVDSPTFNSASYILFSNVLWAATSGQINKWRRQTLHLENTDMGHLAQSKIISIYNFSPAVVPKPLDWGDSIAISGYWFLDNPDLDWTPPQSLVDFMEKARTDGKPLVYIGFGSITVPRPRRVTQRIVNAVLQSGVRAIISKGWSSRMSGEDEKDDAELPPECYVLDKVPHDWLFPKVDAALHHGGAGTTGASLRAGIPTIIKPWFGDQFFWASRVQKLGAGLKVPTLKVSDLAHALVQATTDVDIKNKAASVGEKIRSEDGVHNAMHAIYTYLK